MLRLQLHHRQFKPAIVSGFNSEMFDFEFILGRAKILKMDMSKIPTGFKEGFQLKRKPNTPVKYGNTPDRYIATEMWGISIIDIIHAVKRTAAVNSEIKANGLKYIAKFEKIAKPNRTYIKGEDNSIGKFYSENKIFIIDENNKYFIFGIKFTNRIIFSFNICSVWFCYFFKFCNIF